ncbi:MAG: hypothetical protein ACLUOS_04990 [Odoribacter splanchnicus]
MIRIIFSNGEFLPFCLDNSIGTQKIDLNYEWLGENGVPLYDFHESETSTQR